MKSIHITFLERKREIIRWYSDLTYKANWVDMKLYNGVPWVVEEIRIEARNCIYDKLNK